MGDLTWAHISMLEPAVASLKKSMWVALLLLAPPKNQAVNYAFYSMRFLLVVFVMQIYFVVLLSKRWFGFKIKSHTLSDAISIEKFLSFLIGIASDKFSLISHLKVHSHTRFESSDFTERCDFNRNSSTLKFLKLWHHANFTCPNRIAQRNRADKQLV